MATFMERLRAPGLRGGGFDGSETAGQSDILDQMASERLLQMRLNPEGGGGPMRQPNLAMRQGPVANPKYNPYGRAVDPTKGPMNVVYDQGPEQFNKNLALREKQVDAQTQYNQALAGLKGGELDVKRQNADTNRAKAEAIMARQDLTDSEKQLMIMRQALGIEEMRGDTRRDVTEMTTGSRERVAGADRTSRESEGAANRTSRETIAGGVQAGQNTRQEDDQAFRAGQPGPMAQQLANKVRELTARDPEAARAIVWNPQGQWQFAPDASEEFKQRFTQIIYGPNRQGAPVQPGLGSSALGGQPGASAPAAPAITTPGSSPVGVTKFTANGKSYSIPADRVADFLKLNPGAQKVQ